MKWIYLDFDDHIERGDILGDITVVDDQGNRIHQDALPRYVLETMFTPEEVERIEKNRKEIPNPNIEP